MLVRDEGLEASAEGDGAVEGLAAFVRERMAEREKTKRLLITAVTALVIVASAAMVFAPQGREQVGYALGTVLIILALGTIGVSRFLLKIPGIQLDAREALSSVHRRNSRLRHMVTGMRSTPLD